MELTAGVQAGNRRVFPPLGRIEWVQPISHPPFTPRKRSRNPRANLGLKYERSVVARLDEAYGSAFQAGPWFCYKSENLERRKYCQLDGILQTPTGKVLVEAKYSHCSDAYFQLTNLYLPLIQHLYPGEPLALCEVVKWYDPATVFPCPVVLLPRIHEARPGDFSVHILNR